MNRLDYVLCPQNCGDMAGKVKASAKKTLECYECEATCTVDFFVPGWRDVALAVAKRQARILVSTITKAAAMNIVKRLNVVSTAIDAGFAVKCYKTCSKKKGCCE